MENQYLIPYEKIELTVTNPQIKQEKRRKKKKQNSAVLRNILPFLALLLVGITIAFNFTTIKESFFNNSETEATTDEEPTVDTSNPVNEITHRYKFITVAIQSYEAINESNLNIDFDFNAHTPVDINELQNKYGIGAPVVLIVHFSPQESYSDGIGLTDDRPFYSDEKNVSEIGKLLCNSFNENGIGAIHLESYGHEGALVNGREMYISKINELLNLYPSISYVLDISRDIRTNSEKNIIKETVSLDNKSYAPIKIICGSNDTGLSKSQKESLELSNSLTKYVNSKSDTLITSLTVAKYNLSLDFSVPSIRIDIGSYANSYEEAAGSALILSNYLSNYFTQKEKPSI